MAPKVLPTAISLLKPNQHPHLEYSTLFRHHLPHTSKELDKTTVCESCSNDDVWSGHTSGTQVDQGQDEGGQSESTETKRSWVGELAVCSASVCSRLELTTEGWQEYGLIGVHVSQWISAVIICSALNSSSMILLGNAIATSTDRLVGVDVVVCLGGRHCVTW